MAIGTFEFHRRSNVERSILCVLRGASIKDTVGTINKQNAERIKLLHDTAKSDLQPFLKLREIAVTNGININPPRSPYITTGELQLLCWIAEAQRSAFELSALKAKDLALAIAYCAGLLMAVGLRLPITSLIGNTATTRYKYE